MAKTILSRKALFDQVWSESLAAISRKYNISYSNLRDVCRDMKIPIPENGHWSKLKFGKDVYIPNFCETTDGLQQITLWLRADEEGEEYFSKDTLQLKKNRERVEKQVTKSEKLIFRDYAEDLLITQTRKYLDQSDDRYWRYARPQKTLDIIVSPKMQKRALSLMNRLLGLLKSCGYHVIVKDDLTYVVINNEELGISLREKSNQKRVQDSFGFTTELVPNGKLWLRCNCYPSKEWVDNSSFIEERLLDIISALELVALKEKEDREEREAYWAEQRRQEKIRKDLQEKKEKELSDFKATFQLSNRYQKAIELRNYISAVEMNAATKESLTEDLKIWIDWARKKADWYDPFINATDELLDEVDKDTLMFKEKNRW